MKKRGDEWGQTLKTPLVAVLAMLAAIVLFLIWLGIVVIVTKVLVG